MKRLPFLLLLVFAASCARAPLPVAPPSFTQCFSLSQRHHVVLAKLPQIRIQLGDITGGRVVVSVFRLESYSTVAQQTMRPYDRLEFAEGDVTYYLQLLQLHDTFMSSDSADLLLSTDPGALQHKPQSPVEAGERD